MIRQANYDESVGSMAHKLNVSPHTVRTYRDRLYRKLRVSTLCQAMSVVFATYVCLVQSSPAGLTRERRDE